MKRSFQVIFFGSMALIVLGSVSFNWLLFKQGNSYYMQLHSVRLDPLGLDAYPVASDQRELADVNRTTVAFYGDSRAAYWPAPDVRGFEFINRGVAGETSAQTVLRFGYHLKPLNPQIVVIQVGINDLKTIPLFPADKETIVARCQANISQVVTLSREMGADVIVTTVFPVGQVPLERRPFWSGDVAIAISEVNEYIRSLRDVRVFDAYAVLANGDEEIKPGYSDDLLHLNEAGYERLNEEFARFLQTGG